MIGKQTVLYIDMLKNATRKSRNGDWEITPTQQLNNHDVLAMRRGYALVKFYPELVSQIDAKIKLATESCQNSWKEK